MIKSRNDPAYPINAGSYKGLTKRELIAAMALQGMLSAGHTINSITVDGAIYMADTLLTGLDNDSK
jgi:hypothetical protein